MDRVSIGGTDYDRVFRSQGKIGDNSPGKWILLARMSDQINGWDATTVGSRTTLQPHNNNAASATLLDMAACGALVDVASDEYIADLAVYDNMLFILSQSATTTNTYVSAVTYDLPTDGSTAVSVTGVVDLDPNSSADYLVLDDLFDAPYDIKGRGIEFGADSGDTTMYVASNDGLIYTFKVAAASPSSGTVIMIH